MRLEGAERTGPDAGHDMANGIVGDTKPWPPARRLRTQCATAHDTGNWAYAALNREAA